MDTTASPGMFAGRAGPSTPVTAPAAGRSTEIGLSPRLGAWGVYLGTAITTIGISWDIQWHIEVGPDTFFTLSHLALYTGSALSGIASLVMVLIATSAQRAGRPLPRTVGGTPVGVFGGTFTAPLGYLISGIGAALFLLYGLFDLWWHSLYGFDAVLNSPSHVALFLSISVTMVGSIITFAAARDQVWGRIGILLSVPILITFAPITAKALNNLPLPLDPTIIGIILFGSILLPMAAAVLRQPGAAIGTAVVLGGMQAFLWWFSPWAAVTYAAASGLPLRDGLTPQPPDLPSAMPMFLIVAALVVEGLLWLARYRRLDAKRVLLVAGGATGLIIGATLPLQQVLTDPTASFDAPTILLIAALGIVFGVLGGFLAGRFAIMLRALTPDTEGTR
jgi:hypothetical protein